MYLEKETNISAAIRELRPTEKLEARQDSIALPSPHSNYSVTT